MLIFIKVFILNSEVLSIVKENVNYSNNWWSATTRFTSFFSYTERFHTTNVLNLLKTQNLNGNFLDVGFGSGLLIKKLPAKEITIFGLDISLRNIMFFRKNCRKSKNIYTLPIDPFNSELAFKDDCFSGIICSHVLEHVPDDSILIKELHRVLRPGGIAIFMVPINEEHINIPTHIRKYKKDSLVEKLNLYFEILETGSNDILSYYIREFGIRKKFISTLIKRSLIFVCSFLPTQLAIMIDSFIIEKLRITKKTSQTYILAQKLTSSL